MFFHHFVSSLLHSSFSLSFLLPYCIELYRGVLYCFVYYVIQFYFIISFILVSIFFMFEWIFHFWQCEMDTCSDLFQEWFFFQLFDSHYYYFLIFNFPSLYLIFWKYYWKIFARFAIIIIFFITSDLIHLFRFPHDWKRCIFSYLSYSFILPHSSLFHFPQSKSSYSYFSLYYFHYFYQEKRRLTMAQAAKVRNGQWDKKVQDGSRRRKVKSK